LLNIQPNWFRFPCYRGQIKTPVFFTVQLFAAGFQSWIIDDIKVALQCFDWWVFSDSRAKTPNSTENKLRFSPDKVWLNAIRQLYRPWILFRA
jgi:hypothetical protein